MRFTMKRDPVNRLPLHTTHEQAVLQGLHCEAIVQGLGLFRSVSAQRSQSVLQKPVSGRRSARPHHSQHGTDTGAAEGAGATVLRPRSVGGAAVPLLTGLGALNTEWVTLAGAARAGRLRTGAGDGRNGGSSGCDWPSSLFSESWEPWERCGEPRNDEGEKHESPALGRPLLLLLPLPLLPLGVAVPWLWDW